MTMAIMGLVTGVSMKKGLMGIISLCLVVVYLINLKSHGVEATKLVEEIEEDLELERQLKILNVPSLKTIRTKEGDILDCVDFYKQPALSHPLLKDHKIQMKPTFQPEREINKTSFAIEPLQIIFKLKECPQGTVPIRRTSKDDLLRARALSRELTTNLNESKRQFPGQFIVDVNDEEPYVLHGASAFINVYNPTVEPSQATNAQIWINGGSNDNPNYIMAGWTVNPGLYGDHLTRFFTFWTGDNYKNGCFNTLCEGFVQLDRSMTPSAAIDPISTIGGAQFEVKVLIGQDPNTGNWWLIINNNISVGYWPKELFTSLRDGAKGVSWGGHTQAGSNGVSPPMGSGRFPNEDYACYFRVLEFVDVDYQVAHPLSQQSVKIRVDAKNCYDIHYKAYYPGEGAGFYFGGPGGNCG